MWEMTNSYNAITVNIRDISEKYTGGQEKKGEKTEKKPSNKRVGRDLSE